MPRQNSVFHDVLKRIPWGVFDQLVLDHSADHRVRHLSTKNQLIALLYGQLSGSVSLREIVGGLSSHAAQLYRMGGKAASRSTLADANAGRPSAVFAALFAAMVAMAQRGVRRGLAEAVYLIDSTSVRLSGVGSAWAHFSAKACGAKAHIVYDADAEQPIYAAVTPMNVNDITAAQHMPITPGATYVFDLGYYDYGWWAAMHRAGCRIVTRFKSNTPLQVTETNPVAEDSPILSDRIGLLPKRQAKNRKNPFAAPVREVRVRIETGKILRVLTNDLTATAQQIADLYKRRWAIELFFRWTKQTLKIRHFVGRSENAVRIQIAVALIAYLLLRAAQADQTAVKGALAFARLVRSNLMHRRRIDTLIDPPKTPCSNTKQAEFQWGDS